MINLYTNYKIAYLFYLLAAERLTKISGSAAFFDWVGGDLCRRRAMPWDKNTKGFYRGQGVLPLASGLCGSTGTACEHGWNP